MYTSGWFFAIELATSFKRTVLPVFGWATIRPLCPFPMGENRSIIRAAVPALLSAILNFFVWK
jgi:hypothetical protein